MAKPTNKPRKERQVQPKCGHCHHPKSFHGGGTSRCRALGCDSCPAFVDAAEPVAAQA